MRSRFLPRFAASLGFLMSLLSLTAGRHESQQNEPQSSPESASSPDDVYWSTRFAPPGFSSTYNVMEVYSGELYVGGAFTVFNSVAYNRMARWNGLEWSSVAGGVSHTSSEEFAHILSMTVHDNVLVVAGNFNQAGGSPALNIAGWNGSSWTSYGPGLSAEVSAVGVSNGNLYAATSDAVHQWTGATWVPVGTGLTGDINAIASYGGQLVAAGDLAIGAIGADVAVWNGTSWSSLGTSDAWVNDAVEYDGSLVVGGWFNSFNGVSSVGTARWDGSSWIAMSAGDWVDDLCLHAGTVVAAGVWQQFGAAADGLVQWDGAAWVALDPKGVRFPWSAMSYNDELYIVGNFVALSETDAAWNMARWDGESWNPVGPQSALGLDEPINCMTVWQDKLVAGGEFHAAGNRSASRVAFFDGTEWSSAGPGVNSSVVALTTSGGRLIAGGGFTEAGGNPAQRVAAWDGVEWEALGAGLNGTVLALIDHGGLIAGGSFTASGANPVSRIARWDGAAWQPLGTGLNGTVRCLGVYQGQLVAGGTFTLAGGVPVSNLALWDGSSWHSIGGGTNGAVEEFAIYATELIAGGRFTLAGGAPANRLARWNGATWQPLGDGIDCPAGKTSIVWVYSLAVSAGKLYVGGDFACAGGADAFHVASWDGATWSPLGSGLGLYPLFPGSYAAVALRPWNGSLFVGGFLEQAGGHPSSMIAEWQDPAFVGVPEPPDTGRSRFRVLASPNPFQQATEVRYQLRSAGPVEVTIVDVSGRLIRRIRATAGAPGSHSVRWDGRSDNGKPVQPGVYFARVRTREGTESTRLVRTAF